MKDAYSDQVTVRLHNDPTQTADADSTSVDLDGFEGVLLIVDLGPETDTLTGSVYIELEVEESDDDSTFTDVADIHLVKVVTGTNTGTFAKVDDAAEADQSYATSYIGDKRYVRVVLNVTGTHTTGLDTTVIAVKMFPRLRPAST